MSQLQKQFNVILIGDDGLDRYQFGSVHRISPEAPVPVFNFNYQETMPGMASNVRDNLKALGINVTYYHDKTSTKTRIIDEHSKQHLLRIDDDDISNPIKFSDGMLDADAIVISDYNKGTVTYRLIEEIVTKFKGPVFIDTKKTKLSNFGHAFVKINEPEYINLESECENLIVTRGSNSVLYKDEMFPVTKIPVVDVCGAGDTFLSALVYQYLNTKNVDSSIEFAIKASSITVRNLGVYAPTVKEIHAS